MSLHKAKNHFKQKDFNFSTTIFSTYYHYQAYTKYTIQ